MLIRRIIEGKRNKKKRKKRNIRTTHFDPLHIIGLLVLLGQMSKKILILPKITLEIFEYFSVI